MILQTSYRSYEFSGDDINLLLHEPLPNPNAMDRGSNLNDPSYLSYQVYSIVHRGTKRIISDGLSGVIADGAPSSATVVLLQEYQGMLFEVARVDSPDGAYFFSGLNDKEIHAVAFKQGHNAGISAHIQPED